MIQLKIKLLRPEAVPPSHQTVGASGMDLHACLDQPVVLQSLERLAVPIGIAIELPAGYEGQIRARSGLAIKQGVGLVNGVGTVDSDFRGEVNVLLINWSKEPVTITPGMRIAQLIVTKHETVDWEIAESLSSSERGDAAFGSTGAGGQGVLSSTS